MTWLALLLAGVAVTDLVRGRWPGPVVPEAVGGIVVLGLGALCGLGPDGLPGMLVVVAVVIAWSLAVRRAVAVSAPADDVLPAVVALTVLGAGVVVAVAAAPAAGSAGGAWAVWARDLPWQAAAADPDRLLLLLGAAGAQLATGNLVVRLVLSATGTADPALVDRPEHPAVELKGGRLLGPMERLVILGLGLAGQVTAASVVIAAKGLLRWPELRSDAGQRRIHQLTEYFLVGSFVSWSWALGAMVLVAG